MTFAIAAGVRKSTRSDARYLSTDPLFSTYWTPERDAQLCKLAGVAHIAELARIVGRPVWQVAARIKDLGIPVLTLKEARMPSKGEWIGMATRMALQGGVEPAAVLMGNRSKLACLARWKAWRALLDENPDFSAKGVAAVSGHDHTSVLYGMKMLARAANP